VTQELEIYEPILDACDQISETNPEVKRCASPRKAPSIVTRRLIDINRREIRGGLPFRTGQLLVFAPLLLPTIFCQTVPLGVIQLRCHTVFGHPKEAHLGISIVPK